MKHLILILSLTGIALFENSIGVNPTSNSEPAIVKLSCTELSDNVEDYIGKTIETEFFYGSGMNELFYLRARESSTDERGLSTIVHGFYEDNDKYNTRQVSCNGGSKFFLRIPKAIHAKAPNTDICNVFVVGKLINKTTIIVSSIRRAEP